MKSPLTHLLPLVALLSSPLFAPGTAAANAPIQALEPETAILFDQFFRHRYVANRCGDNTENFLQSLDDRGLLPRNAKLVRIKNLGGSLFGLVNAEFAREATRLGPGETNWGFHVAAEIDGMIYDFDFGNRPEIVSIANWIDRQWLIENPQPYPAYYRVGREEKSNTYQVELFDARTYLNTHGNRMNASRIQKTTLGAWRATVR